MTTTTKTTPSKSKTRASTAKKRAASKASVASKASAAPKAKVAVKANGAVARKTAKAKTTTVKTAPAKTTTVKTANLKTANSKTANAKTSAGTPVKPTRMPVPAVVNAKLADIARTNMNAGLDLVCGLAGAKTPMEAMRLGLAYWVDNVGVFRAQVHDLRKLSADLVTMANEPIRESMRRSQGPSSV